MTEKPRLAFWQIRNMSFAWLGIQFGFGLQMADMSAIDQFLGDDSETGSPAAAGTRPFPPPTGGH